MIALFVLMVMAVMAAMCLSYAFYIITYQAPPVNNTNTQRYIRYQIVNNVIHQIELGTSDIHLASLELVTRHLHPILPLLTTIQKLDLSHNHLDNSSIPMLSQYVCTTCTLRELDLRNNNFGHGDIVRLLDAMRDNQTLHILKISSRYWYDLKPTELSGIANYLRTHPNPINLGLYNVYLSRRILPILMQMMIENLSLTELEIQDNDIADCRPLCYALRSNTRLKRLYLPETIYVRIETQFIDAVRYNVGLRKLTIYKEHNLDFNYQPWIPLLNQNVTLRSLTIGYKHGVYEFREPRNLRDQIKEKLARNNHNRRQKSGTLVSRLLATL